MKKLLAALILGLGVASAPVAASAHTTGKPHSHTTAGCHHHHHHHHYH